MKNLFILMLSVASFGVNSLNHSSAETTEVKASLLPPVGQVTFLSCSSNPSITYFKVLINPINGTPPSVLHKFEDGVFVETITSSGGSFSSAVSISATNVVFAQQTGGTYVVYAAADVAALYAQCGN